MNMRLRSFMSRSKLNWRALYYSDAEWKWHRSKYLNWAKNCQLNLYHSHLICNTTTKSSDVPWCCLYKILCTERQSERHVRSSISWFARFLCNCYWIIILFPSHSHVKFLLKSHINCTYWGRYWSKFTLFRGTRWSWMNFCCDLT